MDASVQSEQAEGLGYPFDDHYLLQDPGKRQYELQATNYESRIATSYEAAT
jgi:hypothetical protein